MKRSEKRDEVEPLRRIPRELDRRFVRLGPGIAEERPHVAGTAADRNNARHLFGELHLRLVIEVRPRHVEVLLRLSDDGFDHVGVSVAGARDGDAGRAVEEDVAIHVLHDRALAFRHHERVVARVGRGHARAIPRDDLRGLRTGQRRLDVRDSGHLRFQRVPAGLSSRRMPRVSSVCLISSARAKFRCRRASRRSSISCSISAGGTGGARPRPGASASTPRIRSYSSKAGAPRRRRVAEGRPDRSPRSSRAGART